MWTETYSLICAKSFNCHSVNQVFICKPNFIHQFLWINTSTWCMAEAFWVVVLCHWVNSSWCFEGSGGFHIQVQAPMTASDPAQNWTLHMQIWNVTATPSYSLHDRCNGIKVSSHNEVFSCRWFSWRKRSESDYESRWQGHQSWVKDSFCHWTRSEWKLIFKNCCHGINEYLSVLVIL